MAHNNHSFSNLTLDFDFFFPGAVPVNAEAAELKFWTKNDLDRFGQLTSFWPLQYDVLRF